MRMTPVALLGAVEIGLIFGVVSLAVFLSFRVLNFPDLTVDGSFALGAAVSAVWIVRGSDPFLATAVAAVAGAAAGLVTAFLNLRFGILHLLASILTMLALYSVNLRIMGRPNISLLTERTILTPFQGMGLSDTYLKPLVAATLLGATGLLLGRFLLSKYGLAMRATGANPRMARAQGVYTDSATYIGIALSNAMVALAGAVFAQMNGFADVNVGTGTILVGLAAVIVGEAMLGGRTVVSGILACCLGSIVYRLAVAAALNSDWLGLNASDLNLVTAILVAVALILPEQRLRLIGAFAGARRS
jgi:putative ABC transport system permease protein